MMTKSNRPCSLPGVGGQGQCRLRRSSTGTLLLDDPWWLRRWGGGHPAARAHTHCSPCQPEQRPAAWPGSPPSPCCAAAAAAPKTCRRVSSSGVTLHTPAPRPLHLLPLGAPRSLTPPPPGCLARAAAPLPPAAPSAAVQCPHQYFQRGRLHKDVDGPQVRLLDVTHALQVHVQHTDAVHGLHGPHSGFAGGQRGQGPLRRASWVQQPPKASKGLCRTITASALGSCLPHCPALGVGLAGGDCRNLP